MKIDGIEVKESDLLAMRTVFARIEREIRAGGTDPHVQASILILVGESLVAAGKRTPLNRMQTLGLDIMRKALALPARLVQ